ncbi:hypothetical protein HKX48_001019 [Thoreauomyces humboldtii]|nr:hypothetical protein HKX48_001019 [Thoreauomyces humboldtii]
MSRHRIVRNLDLDDELDDDYGEDGYDEEDDYNEDEYTYDRNAAQVHSYFTSDDAYPVKAQSPAQAVNLLDEVAKVVGSEFRKEQIAEALKAQGNDVEMAINVLLGTDSRFPVPRGAESRRPSF